MRIIRNEESATLTFIPVDDIETQVIAAISALLQPDDKLVYGGRGRDGHDDRFCTVNLHAGSRQEEQTRPLGNSGSTITENVYTGGIKLVLVGTTEDDKYEVNDIRNTCYFGSSGLIYISTTEVDGIQAIIVTAKRCKLCNSGMISYGECEWNTCNNCADKCEHNYVRGNVHSPGLDIGVGYYCNLCGRGKPKEEGERELSVLEHHLAAQRELGVLVIYKEGPVRTPDQAVLAGRIARGLHRARSRSGRRS